MSNLKRSILLVIPIAIFSFCGGYWLNEYLNKRYYRNEAIGMFVRGLHIGQEKGWLTIHYEKMNGVDGIRGNIE